MADDPIAALVDVLKPESIEWVRQQVIKAIHHGQVREGESIQQAELRALVEAVHRECRDEQAAENLKVRAHNEAVRASLREGYRQSLLRIRAEVEQLNAVRRLIDVRRKTVRMDALVEALQVPDAPVERASDEQEQQAVRGIRRERTAALDE